MTPRSLVRQIADAGGRIWLNGESVRIGANGPLPNAIVEQLRQDKPEVVEVLRLLPVCCECGAKVVEPACAWWGGKPVHLDCGKRAWAREWSGRVLCRPMRRLNTDSTRRFGWAGAALRRGESKQ